VMDPAQIGGPAAGVRSPSAGSAPGSSSQSSLGVAPARPVTATTPGSRAGYQTPSACSSSLLPVQATTTTSLAVAYRIAALTSSLRSVPPSDRLITEAPWFTPHRIPLAMTPASS
jgi:hypothetical protein